MKLTAGHRSTVGGATNVLGHPARSLAWLARALAARGERLEAGQVVLSGSLADALPITAGDEIVADFGPLGHLRTVATWR